MEIKEAIKKANELKQKMKNKRRNNTNSINNNNNSYGYIEAIDTLVRELKMYQR